MRSTKGRNLNLISSLFHNHKLVQIITHQHYLLFGQTNPYVTYPGEFPPGMVPPLNPTSVSFLGPFVAPNYHPVCFPFYPAYPSQGTANVTSFQPNQYTSTQLGLGMNLTPQDALIARVELQVAL